MRALSFVLTLLPTTFPAILARLVLTLFLFINHYAIAQEVTEEMPRFHKIYFSKINKLTRTDDNIVIVMTLDEISKEYFTSLAITTCLPLLSNAYFTELNGLKTISYLNHSSTQGWILDMGVGTGQNSCLALKGKRSAERKEYILQHSLEFKYKHKNTQ